MNSSFLLFCGESIDLGSSLKIDLLSKWHLRYPQATEFASESDLTQISLFS